MRVSDCSQAIPVLTLLSAGVDAIRSMGVNEDNEDFWDDLLAHIRQRVLVPVVGPDLTVVNVGNTEQTFTSLIGQRLAERMT